LPPGKIGGVRMPFQPMLASSSAPRPLAGRWVMEPKFDGWRVIVAIDGEVHVWTRRHDLTGRLPELARLADVIDVSVVLDGELVAGQGRASDFYGVLPGVAARNRRALTFVAYVLPRCSLRSATSPIPAGVHPRLVSIASGAMGASRSEPARRRPGRHVRYRHCHLGRRCAHCPLRYRRRRPDVRDPSTAARRDHPR
jgi:hypothetical protein